MIVKQKNFSKSSTNANELFHVTEKDRDEIFSHPFQKRITTVNCVLFKRLFIQKKKCPPLPNITF